ncbi:bifunctional sugar phosphate isomerase/epimerase/4-hydroxyphenylpyruvate dioxygenase family protein [Microbacterium sp. NPDC091313]
MMRTSIATVCLSGALEDKLAAARAAGFDGVELFEPDLIASPHTPERVAEIAADLGLSLDLYQPFRDFEGVGPDLLEHNLRRAEAKFSLMRRLGVKTMLLCSNVATARSGDEHLAAEQLRELGRLAERYDVRVAYEALAWGRFVDDYEQAARIVRIAGHPRIGLCLDTFHILSRGHSPAAIETIPGASIFFVQVADAPDMTLDPLTWSRHHRLFPGEGSFDLASFMMHLARTGYDGPVSLEVFNDTFRQSDPAETAVDARRSLRWLEHQSASEAATQPASRTASLVFAPLPALPPLQRMDYVEVRTSRLADVRTLLGQLGFRANGPHRTKPVELWSQGEARLVIGDVAHPHQPTVAGLGVAVDGARSAVRRAVDLFASEVPRPHATGEQELLGVLAPDGAEVFFGEAGEGEPLWEAEFGPAPHPPAAQDAAAAISRVDHVNLAQPWQHFDAAVLFFRSVLGLAPRESTDVAAPVGLVRSRALASPDGVVRVALNLAPPATAETIHPQHVAFACSDVLALARRARERGFAPLPIPANYYDDLEARFDLPVELAAQLRELDVMYDRDDDGQFLHFYTAPIGTLFFEVVQRAGGYDGYGASNTPVRLAAQHHQRRRDGGAS